MTHEEMREVAMLLSAAALHLRRHNADYQHVSPDMLGDECELWAERLGAGPDSYSVNPWRQNGIQ